VAINFEREDFIQPGEQELLDAQHEHSADGTAAVPPVQTQRAPEVTHRLLAEDVFTSSVSKTLQLSFSKPLQTVVREHACARSPTASFRNLLLENCRVPLSRVCVHLASSWCNASSCEEASRPENESASHSLTNEAGSLPFGARSVGESISRLVRCQARLWVVAKKFVVELRSSLSHIP
jgi:hypothetical protein